MTFGPWLTGGPGKNQNEGGEGISKVVKKPFQDIVKALRMMFQGLETFVL